MTLSIYSGAFLLRFLSVGAPSVWNDRVVRLEGYDLICEERLEQDLVQLFGLSEVLIIDITRSRWVNSNVIVLALVFKQSVSNDVSDARVKR